MRKLMLFGWLIAIGYPAAGASPPDFFYLPVPLHPQEAINWCWAASGEMVMEFLGSHLTQCAQVNYHFSSTLGDTDCCEIPVPGKCDHTGWPAFDKDYSGRYPAGRRFSSRKDTSALSWELVKEEIYHKKKPIVYMDRKKGLSGHIVVIVGYLEGKNGAKLLFILDPLQSKDDLRVRIPYKSYARKENRDLTYYNIEKY